MQRLLLSVTKMLVIRTTHWFIAFANIKSNYFYPLKIVSKLDIGNLSFPPLLSLAKYSWHFFQSLPLT